MLSPGGPGAPAVQKQFSNSDCDVYVSFQLEPHVQTRVYTWKGATNPQIKWREQPPADFSASRPKTRLFSRFFPDILQPL